MRSATVQRSTVGVAGSGDSDRSEESLEVLSVGVLFVTMLIFLGGTFFMTHKRRIPLPYTVVLFLYGILVGAFTVWWYPDVAAALGAIPPNLLLYIFLPVLIFEGSYTINIHALRRVFPQMVLLASVGLLLNTAFLSVPVKLCFPSWSWYTALLLGSLLSATDPVAVVALLKDLGVEKFVTALVDGEAVMNDSTAIMLFSFLLPAAREGFVAMSPGILLLQCIRLALLPVVLGPLFGFLQSFWLRHTSDGLTKACVTVSVTYVSYYIAAELVGTSGVLTLFFQGIFLSYYYPSLFPGREDNLISATWEFLVHLGNTILFSLVGVILVADVLPTVRPSDVGVVIVLYLAMVLSRLLMLEVLSPVLNIFSYKLDQNRIALLVHAGLRGGVAATLALAVKQAGLNEGVEMLKVTAGGVLLTLLVNATTAAKVVEQLGFKSKPAFRLASMEYAMELMRSSQEHALNNVKRDTKYRNASWMQVEKYVRQHIRNPYDGFDAEKDGNEDVTVNRMLMSAFRTTLWRQRDEEVISETVVAQMAAALSTLIERGELLDVRQMYWYHRRRDGTHSPELEGDTAMQATTHPRRRPRPPSTMSTPRSHFTSQQQQQLYTARDWRTQRTENGTCNSTTVSFHAQVEEIPRHPTNTLSECMSSTLRSDMPHGEGEGYVDAVENDLPQRQQQLEQQPNNSRSGGWGTGEPFMGGAGGGFDGDVEAIDGVGLPPDFLVRGTGDGGGTAAATEYESYMAAQTNRMVANLMRRLLPSWVVLAERFLFGPGFFVKAHLRAQENAFVALLAVVKCLTAISPLKFKFVNSEAQARRVERWMTTQITAANRAIRFFYANFPEATNNVASCRAVVSVANALQVTVRQLHAEHGFGTRATELLSAMAVYMRVHTPTVWDHNASLRESHLVQRAVAASTLGRGLRPVERKAIVSMGLVRKFREGDTITLPDNAFLVVVFGSMRAVYGQWTTPNEHELMESFGDTVGLEALLLPQEFRVDQQRRWRVISTEATALLISFNSIKPFLTERSFRAVKALWRAAASEVLMPFLSRIVTVPENEARTKREYLLELIMAGTPLIGPRDCDLASCETNLNLYFYLRGSDRSGLFNRHTPPCYISIFYVRQLHWVDADAVLYAVPMRVGDRGYVPLTFATPAAGVAVKSPNLSGEDEREEEAGEGEKRTDLEAVTEVGAPLTRNASTRSTTSGLLEAGDAEKVSVAADESFSATVSPIVSLPTLLPMSHGTTPTDEHLLPPPLSFRHRHRLGSGLQQHSSEYVVTDAVDVGSVVSSALEETTRDHHHHHHSDSDAVEVSLVSTAREGSSATPAPLYGENTVATHAGAASIINSVLLGCVPEDPDGLYQHASVTFFCDPLDTPVSPTLTHLSNEGFQSLALSERLGHSASAPFVSSSAITIFYSLERFVTLVPFVNQMFIHYASTLEHLCIAVLRYLRFPADPFHSRHAQATGEATVEFLLNFCVELSLLKRTCRVVCKRHSETMDALNPFHSKNDTDSGFEARVCAWSRRYRLNGTFHLKAMVTEMNRYANERFPDYVVVLRRMVELEPPLREVETAEGMNSLCHRIIMNSKDGVAMRMESLEDAL